MERRSVARRIPQPGEALSRVRLRAGRELAVVNVSNSGLLVEGAARLLPGTHVEVHVVTREGRQLVRSRVVRAHVCALEADRVSYQGAFAFDRIVDTAIVMPAAPVAAKKIVQSAATEAPRNLDF